MKRSYIVIFLMMVLSITGCKEKEPKVYSTNDEEVYIPSQADLMNMQKVPVAVDFSDIEEGEAINDEDRVDEKAVRDLLYSVEEVRGKIDREGYNLYIFPGRTYIDAYLGTENGNVATGGVITPLEGYEYRVHIKEKRIYRIHETGDEEELFIEETNKKPS
ncbi:hypothetical protein IMZ31_21580 (plasmid) [Pontibacillus sp. ALD_SL1]|uniref:hypothetical protein n=1 Tax=Pontibacillus sp. ALD_SL1 TaxID=2777185 RepID=UPI001A95D8C2|nr:hypothetical protein [Pontibacillus sp. ALD_SL1]QST02044.1 hypothetical protein IMZ31_21580 [Pontibacillus sp. ALD_SL1]